jgi:DNA-binding MarR family transcriptional regulator
MSNDFRLANEAWNTYYRAQATIAREFAEADIWGELLTSEYAVLYALSTEPDGLRMSQLNEDALLTQPGMSRLIARLEARGLVCREEDHDDARARRICLTPAGVDIQRRVGGKLARAIADAIGRALSTDQMIALRAISQDLLDATQAAASTAARKQAGP